MAYQTGNIRYGGSFKSIRHWRNRKDSRTYAGEKGGAHRELIMNNPAFKRTRENMAEFGECDMAVRAIRQGMLSLIPEHTDTLFTARMVALVKKINKMDAEGTHGTRAIGFSLNRPLLKTLTFHERKKIDLELRKHIRTSHPETRKEATLSINGLNPGPSFVPGNAQFYRIVNHLSIISDYIWKEVDEKFKSLSPLNTLNTIVYSDYIPVNTPLTVSLRATLPEWALVSDVDTVIQCVGIEYYISSGSGGYLRYPLGSMMVYDVF